MDKFPIRLFTTLVMVLLWEYWLFPGTHCPFYYHGLILILAWRSNHMPSKVWNEITYPFPNFNGCSNEVWEWISNFFPSFSIDVITEINISKLLIYVSKRAAIDWPKLYGSIILACWWTTMNGFLSLATVTGKSISGTARCFTTLGELDKWLFLDISLLLVGTIIPFLWFILC